MRPLKIEFQAFGPYAGYESVDFEAISSKGLFLICGKTGIGKTMILDAMTFALYGRSSGNGRNDFEAMRCTNAAFDTTTFVKFEFENNGEYYLFERRLERKRKRLLASYNVSLKDEDGIFNPLMENAKEKALNEKAEEIIGLDYGQFRQVIVLPQGQFEKLLTSSSEEKEKILTSIFGEEKWQRIADRFYLMAEERKNKLKEIRERIKISLSDEGCDSIAELINLSEDKKAEKKALEEKYAENDYDGIIKTQQDLLSTVNRFKDLHKAESDLHDLELRKEERDAWEKILIDARRADKVRPLSEALESASSSFEKRKKAETDAKTHAEKMKNASLEADSELSSHMAKEKENDSLKEKKIRYDSKRSDYKGIDEAEEAHRLAVKAVSQALSDENKAKEKCETVSAETVSLQAEYNRLRKEHEDLLNSYLSGITGELASALQAGKPCPVCGSTDHPHKAVSSGNSTSKEMVDGKKKEADRKYLELQKKSDELESLNNQVLAKHKILEKASKEEAVLSTDLTAKKKNLVQGINTFSELENEILHLSELIESYEKEKTRLTEKKKTAGDALTEAGARLNAAESEAAEAGKTCRQAEKAVNGILKENGFATLEEAKKYMLSADEAEKLSGNIAEYDASIKSSKARLASLKKELKNIEEPDEEKCRETLDTAEKMRDEYIKNKTVLSGEADRLDKKIKDLTNMDEGMDEKIREADEDFAFAKKLRGDSGTGLQRYVLGIMFSSVIAEANKMLEMVHGGRYRLYRSDDKVQGSNKRGLELKVYDKNSGDHEGRFVSTLSGGEKFLTSLALSIGMSMIAQKKGIRIDALFIDEGFGSLDDESIGDAMNVLNSIHEANGLVGIISHVRLLEDQIPTKLRITEDAQGSHIVESVG